MWTFAQLSLHCIPFKKEKEKRSLVLFCLLLYCNRLSMRDTPHHVGWLQELIQDVPVGNASHSCGNHIKASCVYMAFNTDSSSNNNDNGYLERLTHVGPKRSHIFKGACVQCTHTHTHARTHTHTHTHTYTQLYTLGQWN